MSRRNPNEIGSIDWMTFSLYLSLVGVGWLMIYTVGYGDGYPESKIEFLTSTLVGKQTIFIGISGLLLMLTLIIDWKFWRTFAYLIYGFGMLLLTGVLIFGKNINGASSWYALPGGFSLQPSEFAKFTCCIAMASFLSTYSTNLKEFKSQRVAILLIALPILLIFLQPDAGSALVFTSFFILLFREGMPIAPYIIGISIASLFILALSFNSLVIIFGLLHLGIAILINHFKKQKLYWYIAQLVLFGISVVAILNDWHVRTLFVNTTLLAALGVFHWLNKHQRSVFLSFGSIGISALIIFSTNYAFNNILRPHQQDRINVWLNPEKCDPQGSLYTVLQSKIAISSGNAYGKGFLQGTMTKLNYVPEQSTDFIFCTVGEEQGFVGSLAIIALFMILLLRITTLAERQRSSFSRQYAYGVAGIIFVHFFINIGMTMNLMPIIGIPLPFISYGGSSLMGFSLMIGVLLKLDSNRYSM